LRVRKEPVIEPTPNSRTPPPHPPPSPLTRRQRARSACWAGCNPPAASTWATTLEPSRTGCRCRSRNPHSSPLDL